MQEWITVEFEYDPAKSSRNAEKHGIRFDEAVVLWDDPSLLILPSRYPDEPRFLAIGAIEGKHWTAIFTERVDRTRLISVRRSRDAEADLYERNKQD